MVIVTCGTSTWAWRAAGHGRPAAQFGQQRHRPGRDRQRQLTVNAPLEPVGRLAEQLCRRLSRAIARASKCAASITRLAGRAGDLGGQAAHGAGHRDGPGGVRDHDVIRVEVAQHVVEGFQLLAGLRPADHDGPAEPVGVERVQRLAQLQHEVVRDVHGQRHAAQAEPGQPDAHAQRRGRAGVEAAHLAEHEPVARGGILDAGRVHLVGHRSDIGGQIGVGRVGEPDPVGRGQLPGHTADRERVAPVRRDRDVEHVVGEPAVLREVGAQRRVRRSTRMPA